MKTFYISGVYFKENPDVHKFIEYAKWLKSVSGKNFDKSDIDYALFEILAEYKRCGISKSDVLKVMLTFNPFFVIGEIIRRKKTAKKDIKKCVTLANDLGLKQTGGTKEFPVFKK